MVDWWTDCNWQTYCLTARLEKVKISDQASWATTKLQLQRPAWSVSRLCFLLCPPVWVIGCCIWARPGRFPDTFIKLLVHLLNGCERIFNQIFRYESVWLWNGWQKESFQWLVDLLKSWFSAAQTVWLSKNNRLLRLTGCVCWLCSFFKHFPTNSICLSLCCCSVKWEGIEIWPFLLKGGNCFS